MDRTVKIGFVGCGAFCSGTHIPNAHANPMLETVAFCDLDQARLEQLREEYSPGYVTTDMEKVIADPEIEAIICGTKPHFRLPVMEACVKHGKHLFVEKPLCYKAEEIDPMVSLMRKAPINFMVGFNRPYSPMMQAVKPEFLSHRKGTTLIDYRIIGEGQLWPPSHKEAIYERRESTIIHEITHIFDLLNWLTEREPVRVYTVGGGNTDNIITLTYPDEIVAVIVAGDNSTAGYPKERIEINTNFGVIAGEYFVELRTVCVNGRSTCRTFDYKEGNDKVHNTSITECIEKSIAWRQSVTEEEIEYGYYYDRMIRPDKGHYGELEHFRKCIVEGRKPETDVIKGALANLIAWAAMESWKKGVPVDLDFAYLHEL